MKRRNARERDLLTTTGVMIVGFAAATTSFAELTGLAGHAGWQHHMGILLPLDIDVYGFVATRMWLRSGPNFELKKQARLHAIAALGISMVGNAINHMMDAGAISLGSKMWLLICAVSLIPPATLGALMHLVTLRSARANATPAQSVPMPDHTATVPAVNRAGGREPRHTTAPPLAGAVRPNQAVTEPRPSQRTEPTVPPTAPRPQVTVPPAVPPAEPRPQPTPEADRADRTTEPDWAKTVPKVKRGGRPAKAVLDKARKIYREQHCRGVILTDRVLEAAVNEAFDEKVIGRRACARVIMEERQKMRTEKAR